MIKRILYLGMALLLAHAAQAHEDELHEGLLPHQRIINGGQDHPHNEEEHAEGRNASLNFRSAVRKTVEYCWPYMLAQGIIAMN